MTANQKLARQVIGTILFIGGGLFLAFMSSKHCG